MVSSRKRRECLEDYRRCYLELFLIPHQQKNWRGFARIDRAFLRSQFTRLSRYPKTYSFFARGLFMGQIVSENLLNFCICEFKILNKLLLCDNKMQFNLRDSIE